MTDQSFLGRFNNIFMPLEDFKEIFDTRLLIPVFGIALIWMIIDFLMQIPPSGQPLVLSGEIISIFLFTFMILFSLGFLLFLGIHADFKENNEYIFVMFAIMFAFMGVIFTEALIGIMRGMELSITNFSLLWNVPTFSLPTSAEALKQPIIFNFISFSQTLNINPTTLYNVLTNCFFVAPAEELAFRGAGTYLCTKALEPLTGKDAKGGVLFGGLIANGAWALVHTIQSYKGSDVLPNVLAAYCAGIFFLVAMMYCKNIIAPIATHALFNSMIVIMGAVTGT